MRAIFPLSFTGLQKAQMENQFEAGKSIG